MRLGRQVGSQGVAGGVAEGGVGVAAMALGTTTLTGMLETSV